VYLINVIPETNIMQLIGYMILYYPLHVLRKTETDYPSWAP